jgi:20S proteasome subunit beta 2
MGSGSLQAMTIIEDRFKDDMSREEAISLIIDAITAGIYHDLGSGSNVDYCVITKDKAEMFRNAVLHKDLKPINL